MHRIGKASRVVLLHAAAWAVLVSSGFSAGTETTSAGAGSGDGAFSASDRQLIGRYLQGLAKPDGGYGWAEQYDSHLNVTFAVVGAYHTLEMAVPQANEVAAYVRRGHPITGPQAETRKHWTELREFDAQQIQTLLWLVLCQS